MMMIHSCAKVIVKCIMHDQMALETSTTYTLPLLSTICTCPYVGGGKPLMSFVFLCGGVN